VVQEDAFAFPELAGGPVALVDVDADAIPELVHLDFKFTGSDFPAPFPTPPPPDHPAHIDVHKRVFDVLDKPVLPVSGGPTTIAATPTNLATIEDIAPGASRATPGDFLSDGRLNALFLDVDRDPRTFQIYSLDTERNLWIGGGPTAAPLFFPKALWENLSSRS
jgi:hypothetical protein